MPEAFLFSFLFYIPHTLNPAFLVIFPKFSGCSPCNLWLLRGGLQGLHDFQGVASVGGVIGFQL